MVEAMNLPVQVGVGLPVHDAADLLATARLAEDLGLDHVSIADLVLGNGTPALDVFAAASAVAAVTDRIGIELGVVDVPARNLLWLAAQVQAVQHLSGGRLLLGVGIGGFPNDPLRTTAGPRGRALDDALERLPGLVTGTDPDVRLAPAAAMPPVLVGGNSAAALARAHRIGGGWFPSLLTPAELAERDGRTERLHVGLHAALGPDRDTAHEEFAQGIAAGFGMPLAHAREIAVRGDAADLAGRIAAFAAAGATSVTVAVDGLGARDQLAEIAKARAVLR
jgi:alkanesulfonate monooxygenase SsuD/methylene tetrahydromethanopterin reductase-like flavin-dependent oxidoreductase (luciferase family)